MTKPPKSDNEFVHEILYTFMAPGVTMPGYEDMYTPHKDRVMAQRVAHHPEIFETKRCTEYEAMLYVSTATLVHPVSREWVHIYGWLFDRHYTLLSAGATHDQKLALGIEDSLPLDSQEQQMLAGLRAWICKKQMEHLKSKLNKRDPDAEAPAHGKAAVSEPTVEVQYPLL